MSTHDRAAQIEAFTEAWEAGDVDALMALMAEGCRFRASVGPEPGVTFTGRDEVRRGFEQFLRGGGTGPAPETEAEEPLVSQDFAVTRWTTRIREPGGGPTTVVRACDIFEFDGERISAKDTYRKVLPAG